MAMGIYDREYYRREGPGILDSLSRTGQVCKWLILLNVGIFVLQLVTRRELPDGRVLDGPVTDWLILFPPDVLHGQVWRLLTYAFLHSTTDLLHIVFNMLVLWWFGSEIESLYGSPEFATFYVAAALLGGLAFQAWAMTAPGRMFHPCLGASGAVTAVMVLYACHFPTRIIYLFFFLPVPIWAFVAGMVAFETFVLVKGVETGTAVVVHLAGAGFGFAYHKLQWRVSPLWTWLLSSRGRVRRPRLRVYAGDDDETEPVPVAGPPKEGVDEHLEAKLDAVLEKVARSGQASLSASEREILFRASEIYKKRRS
jgi:membrane associated rhomboid family serine protease